MWLADLRLRDFRNYQTVDLSFEPGTVLLVGPNAQGKTNLLEAIYTAALGRSPRAGRDVEVIRFGCDRAYARAVAQGARTDVLEVAIDRATGGRRNKVNGVAVGRGQLLGRLVVVLAGPLDDEVIRGAPAHRRRVMDAALSQVSPSYFFALTRYIRVVKQRNQLLREASAGAALGSWDDQVVELGAVLIERRRRFVERLGERAAVRHARLAGGAERLGITYLGAVDAGDERSALARALVARRAEEIRRGTSLVGPHRDDLRLEINGVDVRTYGSRGQHHTAALSLRLAEVDLLREELGEWPVVLLDDVLAHLDASRQALLLREVEGPQVLLTHTEFPPAEAVGLRELRVRAGVVVEESRVSAQGSSD
ncbi:MAG TPA: DNA replication/repair protein RecF [bacterium]|nr:DNA replication/repair protein RecF [bacterium]